MKISELVKKLEEIKDEEGDLEVIASIPYSPTFSEPVVYVTFNQIVEIFGKE